MSALQMVEYDTFGYDWSTLEPGPYGDYHHDHMNEFFYKNHSMSTFSPDYYIDPTALSGGDRHKFVMIGNYTGFRQPGFQYPRLKVFSTGDGNFRPHMFPMFNLMISHSKDEETYWDHVAPCEVVNTCSWVSFSDSHSL